MKQLILFLSSLPIGLLAQYGLIQNDNYRYGPCLNYLNILGYNYSFADLKKDSLVYLATEGQPAAVFIQKNGQLLNAKFYDKNNNLISGGSFENGNGKLVISYNRLHQYIYTFSEGRLNDTSSQATDGKIKRLLIFKNNILIKQDWVLFNRTVANYDENGFAHDSTLVYGRPARTFRLLFYARYYAPYNKKLYMVNIYEHGHLKAQVFYRKDGTVKKRTNIKYIPKDYFKKPYKKLLVVQPELGLSD